MKITTKAQRHEEPQDKFNYEWNEWRGYCPNVEAGRERKTGTVPLLASLQLPAKPTAQ
ncbi:MAG: hypothetical protein RBU21_12710 [FCB group bacterium]|jgi:hypothetical protein|nr:hypothetical protein [FCB group bacterium]